MLFAKNDIYFYIWLAVQDLLLRLLAWASYYLHSCNCLKLIERHSCDEAKIAAGWRLPIQIAVSTDLYLLVRDPELGMEPPIFFRSQRCFDKDCNQSKKPPILMGATVVSHGVNEEKVENLIACTEY